jgi:hypothetical protein
MQHLRHNICAGNADHFHYTVNWMAHAVQRPEIQPGVAIILRGKEGTGKGVFVTMLGRCFGPHFRHVVNEKHLTGNFNAHLQQCTLLYADEAFFAGDRGHESTLKALITEDSILIEPKGLDCFAVRNCVHLVMASNADWVVPASADARRHLSRSSRIITGDDRYLRSATRLRAAAQNPRQRSSPVVIATCGIFSCTVPSIA